MQFQVVFRWVFWALMLIVPYLTLTPNPDDAAVGGSVTAWLAKMILGNAQFSDKVGHFVAYAALGSAAGLGQLRLFNHMMLTWAALVILGIALEFGQGFIAQRSPEFLDAVANSAGVVAGAIFSLITLWGVRRLA